MMDELHREIEKFADKIHELDVQQHVLNTNLLVLTANVASLTSSVTSLSVIINRHQGALSVVRWLWGCIGMLAGSALTLLVKLKS